MLRISRKVMRDFGARNCVILDLPDGRRVRLWIIPDTRERGSVGVGIDAPLDVKILRGEHLDPLELNPNSASPVV
jgi:hypothetical protein